jgi:hypothetical protein
MAMIKRDVQAIANEDLSAEAEADTVQSLAPKGFDPSGVGGQYIAIGEGRVILVPKE